MKVIMRLCHAPLLLTLIFSSLPVWAFDASKVPDGLYYNGTNVDQQLWTPFFLAHHGKLIDPFEFAKKNGVKALEGRGQTTMLYAVTPFLYGGCSTQTELLSIPPLIADVPTVFVMNFLGKDCQHRQATAFENYRRSSDRRGSNPFPTLYINQPDHGAGPVWSYGVPGRLVGKPVPINAYTVNDIGANPSLVNGVVSRMAFIPLPVIEPDLTDIALADKKPIPKYPVSVLEAAHRSTDVVITPELLHEAQVTVKRRLWNRYFPRLFETLGGKFGGIKKSYFELGLIQGIDLDNQTSFDYAGVARIGTVLMPVQARLSPASEQNSHWLAASGCGGQSDWSLVITNEDETVSFVQLARLRSPDDYKPTQVWTTDTDGDGTPEFLVRAQYAGGWRYVLLRLSTDGKAGYALTEIAKTAYHDL